MDHAQIIREVAQAIHGAYSQVERQPPWNDLHEDAQAEWCHIARVAINTYRQFS